MNVKNKTIKLSDKSLENYKKMLVKIDSQIKEIKMKDIINKTINGDTNKIIKKIPDNSIDLIITDPPYNLRKKYNEKVFLSRSNEDYEKWLKSWINHCYRILKPNGSMYICTDWKSSVSIFNVLRKYFIIKNRITWSREKGRGSNRNWKNNIEDIFFVSKSKNYYFNADAVKIKKKVIAPYKDENGNKRDWFEEAGNKYRLTHHPNIWTDLSIPFWSMKENTFHPTQKPEKLIAKLILASSKEHDLIFDPFLGSGTTSVVAKKLNRHFIGIELDQKFALISEKRLDLANEDQTIQGYNGHHFLDKGIK